MPPPQIKAMSASDTARMSPNRKPIRSMRTQVMKAHDHEADRKRRMARGCRAAHRSTACRAAAAAAAPSTRSPRRAKTPTRQVDSQQQRQRHAEQRRMRHGVAEIGHPPPDDEAAERSGRQRQADAGNQRAGEEVVKHRAGSRVSHARADVWRGSQPQSGPCVCTIASAVRLPASLVMVAVVGVAMVGDASRRHAARGRPADGCDRGDGCRRPASGWPRAPNRRRYSGLCADRLRRAAAADMAVEADHGVGLGHHDVQVVARSAGCRSRSSLRIVLIRS